MTEPKRDGPKPLSVTQLRILEYMREHHPRRWVTVSGISVQQCRPMKTFLEMRGKSGSYEIRLIQEKVA